MFVRYHACDICIVSTSVCKKGTFPSLCLPPSSGIYSTNAIFFCFQADLSCRNTKQTVGAIYTRTNFVTLKYVTDGWGTSSNGFRLVITAVKDPSEYLSMRTVSNLFAGQSTR
ncbi:hypothetical protein ALC57_15536 [Trachymyrmex cornetzi]|uniref:CUB domain-containing protein n=1 Tax=Trachymyrmex cornetzi TaxID=471704 RepID=A0A151IWV3_9HYME|nr:hypothetical protein ALC57_15536 [Trachymyrmex cornetzi]